jgi:hypothetical protein
MKQQWANVLLIISLFGLPAGAKAETHREVVISKTLPECSVIRPTTTASGGAVATIKAFTEDLLFLGQSAAFFDSVNRLAIEADSVPGGF